MGEMSEDMLYFRECHDAFLALRSRLERGRFDIREASCHALYLEAKGCMDRISLGRRVCGRLRGSSLQDLLIEDLRCVCRSVTADYGRKVIERTISYQPDGIIGVVGIDADLGKFLRGSREVDEQLRGILDRTFRFKDLQPGQGIGDYDIGDDDYRRRLN